MIKLSVVIPTFNRRQILEQTLPRLFAQEFQADEYEVIVVVNGSTDGTEELLSPLRPKCGFQVLRAQKRGAGAARNVGISAASGKLVLFLDDDLLCAPDLLQLHASAHQASGPDVVHGPIYIAPEGTQSLIRHLSELFYESYYRHLDPEMNLRFPDKIGSSLSVLSSLVNSSMPRQVLVDCGGFDEEISAAEDLELGLRLYEHGCTFRILPAAAAQEIYLKTSHQYLQEQAKALGVSHLRVGRMHPEYRGHSPFSTLAETRRYKKLILNVLMHLPFSVVPLIAFPLRWERLICRFAPLRDLGLRVLSVAERLTWLRSAADLAGSWAALQSEFGHCCPVLLYHHVGPVRPGMYGSLNVSAKAFERQIRWLASKGYRGVTPSEWLHWLKEGKGLSAKPIIISFDDAYADIAEFALPVLQRYGFGAVVYVVSSRIGSTNTWDESNGSGTLHLMTAAQIKLWANQGIEFGAHSRTHADLTALTEAECISEVARSKSELSGLLGKPVLSFAYPYGHFNESVRATVSDEFELAFSTIESLNFLSCDRHLLRRIYVGPKHSLFEFALNVRRGKSVGWFDDLRGRLAVRTRFMKATRALRPNSSR